MLANERYVEILDLVRRKTVVRTQELIDHLGVSRETIRRDLTHLEKEGLVKRVYGGITAIDRSLGEPPYQARETTHSAEKRAIGKKAAAFIEDGDVLLFDGGTTVIEVARQVHEFNDLTIITNSWRAAYEVMPRSDAKVYMLGGLMRDGDFSTSGYLAETALKDFYVDKAFIGVGGLTPDEGVTDYHEPEARLRRLMAQRAKQVIVVADHSKIGVVAFVHSCDVDLIDVCVTDSQADRSVLDRLAEKGVDIVVAHAEDG